MAFPELATWLQQASGSVDFSDLVAGEVRLYPIDDDTWGFVDSAGVERILGTSGAPATFTSVTLTGAAGAGFLHLPEQASKPSTPTNAARLYTSSGNALAWVNESGFAALLQSSGLSADRTFTLPNNDGTFALATGLAAGQTLIGGTAADTVLTLQGNSAGAGNTATNKNVRVLVGNSGALEAITVLNNGSTGFNTPAPASVVDVTPLVVRSGILINRFNAGADNNDAWGIRVRNSAHTDALQFGMTSSTYTTGGSLAAWLGNSEAYFYYPSIWRVGTGVGATAFTSFSSSGQVTIGGGAFTTRLRVIDTTATTNAVVNTATLDEESTGTVAASFGGGLLMALESDTTAAQSAARLRWYWNTATNASRKAYALLSAFDTAERDVIGWGANGTVGLLGFYGISTAPVVQYATTGTTTGFTAGAGTPVLSDSTFTGNTGATAYTIGDVVRAMKLVGLIAA